MPEYLRVRQPETGTEYSIVASAVAAFPSLIVLDKPATRADGTPIPPKPHTPLGIKSDTKRLPSKGHKATNTGHTANTSKEQS